MSISYKGYKENTLTLEQGADLTVGAPVTVNANGAAVPASTGAAFIGVCTAIRNGFASIQTDGYTELEYTGTAPSTGLATLVAAGSNKVKAGGDNDIALYKVVKLDTVNSIVGIIL
jgi:hypothetical protein